MKNTAKKVLMVLFLVGFVAGMAFAQAKARATVELAISGTTPLGIRLSYTVEASSESDAIAEARRLYYAQYQNRAGTVIEAFSTVKWLNGPPPSSSSSPSSPSTPAVNVTGYRNVITPATPTAPIRQPGVISKDQLGSFGSTPSTPSTSTPTPRYEVASPMEVAGYYFDRGYASFNKRDYETAIADYTESIRLDPNSAKTHYERGKTYSEKGDYDRAIADYTEAIRLDPNYVYSYGYRAYAYIQKGNYTQARTDLDRVFQYAPENADAKNLDAELKRRGY